jgi:hypothetical protein
MSARGPAGHASGTTPRRAARGRRSSSSSRSTGSRSSAAARSSRRSPGWSSRWRIGAHHHWCSSGRHSDGSASRAGIVGSSVTVGSHRDRRGGRPSSQQRRAIGGRRAHPAIKWHRNRQPARPRRSRSGAPRRRSRSSRSGPGSHRRHRPARARRRCPDRARASRATGPVPRHRR